MLSLLFILPIIGALSYTYAPLHKDFAKMKIFHLTFSLITLVCIFQVLFEFMIGNNNNQLFAVLHWFPFNSLNSSIHFRLDKLASIMIMISATLAIFYDHIALRLNGNRISNPFLTTYSYVFIIFNCIISDHLIHIYLGWILLIWATKKTQHSALGSAFSNYYKIEGLLSFFSLTLFLAGIGIIFYHFKTFSLQTAFNFLLADQIHIGLKNPLKWAQLSFIMAFISLLSLTFSPPRLIRLNLILDQLYIGIPIIISSLAVVYFSIRMEFQYLWTSKQNIILLVFTVCMFFVIKNACIYFFKTDQKNSCVKMFPIDTKIVNSCADFPAQFILILSGLISFRMRGSLQSYSYSMILGTLILLYFFI